MYICYASYDWYSYVMTIWLILKIRRFWQKYTRNLTFYILQEHVKNYQKQVNELKSSQEELEHCGRRLCIRIDGVPMTENETSSDILQNVKSIIEESSSEIPDVAIARPIELVKHTPTKHLGWNVKALLFCLRHFGIELFYHNRKNLKSDVKVKLDLNRKRYLIFT